VARSKQKNWWTTLPGVLTALGTLLAAITGFLTIVLPMVFPPNPVGPTKPEKLSCVAGIDGVLDDNQTENPGSLYTLEVWVDKQLVYSRSAIGDLAFGDPHGGPFTTWQERDFPQPVQLTSGGMAVFRMRLTDTQPLHWVGIKRIYAKCGNRTYSRVITDRERNKYQRDQNGAPLGVGIIDAGKELSWTLELT
jgi:hypothetical protein